MILSKFWGIGSSNMKPNYRVSMTTSITEETSRRTIVKPHYSQAAYFGGRKAQDIHALAKPL